MFCLLCSCRGAVTHGLQISWSPKTAAHVCVCVCVYWGLWALGCSLLPKESLKGSRVASGGRARRGAPHAPDPPCSGPAGHTPSAVRACLPRAVRFGSRSGVAYLVLACWRARGGGVGWGGWGHCHAGAPDVGLHTARALWLRVRAVRLVYGAFRCGLNRNKQ